MKIDHSLHKKNFKRSILITMIKLLFVNLSQGGVVAGSIALNTASVLFSCALLLISMVGSGKPLGKLVKTSDFASKRWAMPIAKIGVQW